MKKNGGSDLRSGHAGMNPPDTVYFDEAPMPRSVPPDENVTNCTDPSAYIAELEAKVSHLVGQFSEAQGQTNAAARRNSRLTRELNKLTSSNRHLRATLDRMTTEQELRRRHPVGDPIEAMNASDVDALLRLCHPDRHDGAPEPVVEAAGKMTARLLDRRRELRRTELRSMENPSGG